VKRVLICANPDLNLIDGSSIWSQTIALAVAATGKAKVDFIAKTKPKRKELFRPILKNPNIEIIDGTKRSYWSGKKFRRLTLPMMAELAVKLDQKKSYDVIVLRGFDIAQVLLWETATLRKAWIYLTDIPQCADECTITQKQTIKAIALGCEKILCQSNGFIHLWKRLAPELDAEKIVLYSPVIQDPLQDLIPLDARSPIAIYAGKFKKDWMTLEMATLWPEIHEKIMGSKLLMIGDKIHFEPEFSDYQRKMRTALKNTDGLRWLGALPREDVLKEMGEARVGLSWRAETMNDTIEYSTKILEYGSAGCAVILNRNPLHEELLGEDYPLFANSEDEYRQQLSVALTDIEVANIAAQRVRNLAQQHTFSQRVETIGKWLESLPKRARRSKKAITRVLVAGHDLKFFKSLQRKLEATGEFEFIIDQWKSHQKHDKNKSRKLLEQADVIFCEWCLGNLKWYSHNKKPHQRLVARFHLQEKDLPYVAEANWDAIDFISYVSEFIRREGQKAFDFPYEKTSVISNLLDESKFTPKRKTANAQYTLGIVGVAPARKRMDRAIDLLEKLLEKDNRYCLRVKGKNPLDYIWLLKRDEELAYYKNVYERINSNPRLRHKVIFDPSGDDVNEWFTMVGFILSPSDFESFHMSIGEGMLTGAVPIIWNWDGADEIWSAKYVVDGVSEALDRVVSNNRSIRENVLQDVKSMHSSEKVIRAWAECFRANQTKIIKD
jgi:glycosyltransferase involved in cell wall biosynthesis